MIFTACFTLAVVTMHACYSTNADGEAILSCSDALIEGIPTCEEYRRRLGFGSPPKSSSSVILTFPVK